MPSTAIRSFAYLPEARRLDIQFTSGHHYSYFDVPPAVARGLERAPSKGGYFHRAIRDRFRFIRVRRR